VRSYKKTLLHAVESESSGDYNPKPKPKPKPTPNQVERRLQAPPGRLHPPDRRLRAFKFAPYSLPTRRAVNTGEIRGRWAVDAMCG
jgi:hypothetical protein